MVHCRLPLGLAQYPHERQVFAKKGQHGVFALLRFLAPRHRHKRISMGQHQIGPLRPITNPLPLRLTNRVVQSPLRHQQAGGRLSTTTR